MNTSISFGKMAPAPMKRAMVAGLTAIALPVLAANEFQMCNSHGLVRGAEMAVDKGCLGCHTLGAKRVGPTYSDIAARYDSSPAMAQLLASKIRHGSSGAWGAAAMPANAVSPDEALILARWILSLRHPAAPDNQFSSRFLR